MPLLLWACVWGTPARQCVLLNPQIVVGEPGRESALFGRESFGSNYMLCLPAVIAGSILFSTLLAPAVYAANASTDDDDDAVGCVGAACFGDTFLATAAACLVGAASAAGLLVKSRRLYELQ